MKITNISRTSNQLGVSQLIIIPNNSRVTLAVARLNIMYSVCTVYLGAGLCRYEFQPVDVHAQSNVKHSDVSQSAGSPSTACSNIFSKCFIKQSPSGNSSRPSKRSWSTYHVSSSPLECPCGAECSSSSLSERSSSAQWFWCGR